MLRFWNAQRWFAPLLAALSSLLYLLLTSGSAYAADASVLNGMRAIHMGGNWGANREFDQFMDADARQGYVNWLKSNHVNWVGISVALYVNNSMDSEVKRKYPPGDLFILTYSDEELTAMIQTLHANGIKVYLTLAFENHGPDQSDDPVKQVHRAMFGRPNAWQWSEYPPQEYWPWDPAHPDHETFVAEFWQSYTQQAVYFATLAESLGVEMYSLGTETDGLFRTRTDTNWPYHFNDELKTMVAAVRDVYSGLLTYDQLSWTVSYDREFFGESTRWVWQDLDLDVIGLSAYFELSDSLPASRMPYADLKTAWEAVFANYLLPVRADNPALPIVFTEYGYTDSIGSPHIMAYEEFAPRVFTDKDGSGEDDGQETQADIHSAFFATNRENSGLVQGAFLWGHDWADDALWDSFWGWARHFAVRDKPAEDIVRAEYAAIAATFASLSGTIVDAGEDATPVYPVVIDLLDPVTGLRIDIATVNGPDGTYELIDIPPGTYKIFFNAIGTANNYADELYDEVFCDNGNCNMAGLGSDIVLAAGSNVLDAQLVRQTALSGRVTNSLNLPLQQVAVELLDDNGTPVGYPAITDFDGQWVKGIPDPGSYYVRTLGQSTPGYRPEVWDDVPCDGCDVVAEGTPIVVSGDDVTGIDIELLPELIFSNGLE